MRLRPSKIWISYCCAIVLIISALVLLGWAWDIRTLKSVMPGYITMKANTALSISAVAVAIWLQRRRSSSHRSRFLSAVLFAGAAAVAVLTMGEYLLGRNFGIDEFLFADPDAVGGKFPPGRLAPITAFNVIILSLAGAALYFPRRPFYRFAQFLGLTAFLISFQALIGYLFGVTYTFGKAFYTQMAVHTTVLFIFTSLALLLSRMGRGYMRVFTAGTASARVVRMLLGWAIVVPPLVEWLQSRGVQAGLYDADFGVLIRVIGNEVFFTMVVWRTALALHEAERERIKLEAAQNRIQAEKMGMQQAARLKSEFLATMSHEIRTPLHGVLGMTSLLLDTPLSAEQRDYAGTIRRSGEALLLLLNDLLDFSKIEAGKLEFESVSFRPADLFGDLEKAFSILAGEKGITLHVAVDGSIPTWLRGDPARLRQILANLLANAVKFTAAGEVGLRVSTVADDPSLRHFEIFDTGIGIDEATLPKLFRPFSQADASMNRRYGGSGLGLSISKLLAEGMGGAIGVESRPGLGSRFWFTARLPEDTAPAPEPSAETVASPAFGRGRRVLLVEDNEINQLIAKRLVEKFGFTVDVAVNGREALEALARERYCLVLMDCQMPEMDGFEATRQIRRNPNGATHDVPIIAMTANAMAGDRERCLAAGMNDYLPKPVSTSALERLLRHWSGA